MLSNRFSFSSLLPFVEPFRLELFSTELASIELYELFLLKAPLFLSRLMLRVLFAADTAGLNIGGKRAFDPDS